MTTPQKLIIDTDPGDDVDDMLALAFALLRPELDIRAITTITPLSEKRARMVRKLLRLLGHEPIPVAAGSEYPLRGPTPEEKARPLPPYVGNQFGFVTEAEATALPASRETAVDLLIRTVEENAGQIAIAAIGPPTNIAAALRKKPTIAGKIRWLALMGGEVHLERGEHNLSWDVEASEIVLNAGVPLFLGTWDVTRRFVLTPDDCARIRAHGTPLTEALSRCIDLWWPHKGGKVGPVMYDLSPILWSYDRSYHETRPMCVQIETLNKETRGRTLVRSGSPNAEVTVDMRADAVHDLYLKTILR